uniref:porimin-like n=1 Tax=Jaculus jaculus TaxID=51337 RepID=UPI001E1B38A5|nr:porimin-like [Jaculus jaculus]
MDEGEREPSQAHQSPAQRRSPRSRHRVRRGQGYGEKEEEEAPARRARPPGTSPAQSLGPAHGRRPPAPAGGAARGGVPASSRKNSNAATESIMQHASESNGHTVNPPTTPVSVVPSDVTAATVKPTTISKVPAPGDSTRVTSTALKPTPKATSVSPNVTQMSTFLVTTAHNSLLTPVTTRTHSKESQGSNFDRDSFVDDIVLTLGVLSTFYVGCKAYCSRRDIQYRSIDEHDAII